MERTKIILSLIMTFCLYSCVSLEKVSRHSFDSGFYRLKSPGVKSTEVYVDLAGDSVNIYDVSNKGKSMSPVVSSFKGIRINDIKPGNFLYNSTLIRKSLDFDLSTIIAKYRPASSGVPNQLSSNINAALYLGFRRDFFIIRTHSTPLNYVSSHIRQIGFDAGLFAGLGITPVNPTVTNLTTILEYDGLVFQKGVAGFFTIENMSVGIALGFDNLLDKNSRVWIFNQKPWIGLVLGIANF
jgi:hypothetical protein